MSFLTPSLNSKGKFTLKSPLSALLSNSLEYTCTKVETMQSAAASGIDILATYYTPIQLDAAAFAADLAAGAVLVTLQASVSDPIVVPSSYFTETVSNDGIRYLGMMIGLDLAMLPADFDLSPLKQRLHDVVLATIGVNATARVLVTTLPQVMTQDQHSVIEATRANNKTLTNTDFAEALFQRNRADSLQQQNTLLIQYVQAHHGS